VDLEYEEKSSTLGEALLLAMSKNCELVIAESNQLQFDLDSYYSLVYCEGWIERKLSERVKPTRVQKWNSRNGNWHIMIDLPRQYSQIERIALQSQGGSDPVREWSSLCRVWDGCDVPIRLFKPLPKLLMAGAA
jgi:hypothetical protein